MAGTQRESKNYKQRIPAIPYMYGNGEAGVTLRNFLRQGTTLDIHYMMNYIHAFSYEWNAYHNPELEVPTQFSHDLFVSYNFGKQSEFTVSAECTNCSTLGCTTISRCRNPAVPLPSNSDIILLNKTKKNHADKHFFFRFQGLPCVPVC